MPDNSRPGNRAQLITDDELGSLRERIESVSDAYFVAADVSISIARGEEQLVPGLSQFAAVQATNALFNQLVSLLHDYGIPAGL